MNLADQIEAAAERAITALVSTRRDHERRSGDQTRRADTPADDRVSDAEDD